MDYLANWAYGILTRHEQKQQLVLARQQQQQEEEEGDDYEACSPQNFGILPEGSQQERMDAYGADRSVEERSEALPMPEII
jgi:hypothetical protein